MRQYRLLAGFVIIFLFIYCRQQPAGKKEAPAQTSAVVQHQDTARSLKVDSPADLRGFRSCFYKRLFKSGTIAVDVKRIKIDDSYYDSCIVNVRIVDDASKKSKQIISFTTRLLTEDNFTKPGAARSYITGKNVRSEVVDNEYGDIVVADFNFDAKEDIALLSDIGGNAGPYYNFYIQGEDGEYHIDQYLTDSMMLFPSHFDKTKKTLTTLGHAGVAYVGENIYKLDMIRNKWLHLSYRIIRD
ncbi:MAG: hypothetical protein J0H74_36765 [Chitinophagaceae bacterium]|nr:hypothetical protein [Chitinophagaceae bacterium]